MGVLEVPLDSSNPVHTQMRASHSQGRASQGSRASTLPAYIAGEPSFGYRIQGYLLSCPPFCFCVRMFQKLDETSSKPWKLSKIIIELLVQPINKAVFIAQVRQD